ncbi:MAG: winged helix DNA-binding domain-containing protein [Chloroflexota bacterium]|nr:winged helix DNA-binding domain-containing protein [Chloroflexota bacterium]
MMLHLSSEQARRFLTSYHFRQTDLAGVFAHLGTVQYDPLSPVGRNPDLVFQARIPGYRVDDWKQAAYNDRLIYDSWDKQACLVPSSDWPLRAYLREVYRPYHDREILATEAGAATAQAILAAIDEQGPLSSQDFEDRERYKDDSWYGLTRTNRVLRALWVSGDILTHHRKSGRHYYDRPKRVIPPEHYTQPPLLDQHAYHRWILFRRYQAVGLLRPNAETAIWSACGESAVRKQATAELVEDGTLTPVRVGEKGSAYYMLSSALPMLEAPLPPPRVIFLGPLDSILWDRKALLQIFDFDYIWEVYKPPVQRRWGYYVLPVFYGDRFIARLDSRLEKGVWNILRWWWEPDVVPDAEMLDALRLAAQNFLHYLCANDVRVDESVEDAARSAIVGAAR